MTPVRRLNISGMYPFAHNMSLIYSLHVDSIASPSTCTHADSDTTVVDGADASDLTAADINLTAATTDSGKRCQCDLLFCNDCLDAAGLSLRGCWYEERSAEQQEQDFGNKLERRKQLGLDMSAPYNPVVRIRHHPDGRKLVFTQRCKILFACSWNLELTLSLSNSLCTTPYSPYLINVIQSPPFPHSLPLSFACSLHRHSFSLLHCHLYSLVTLLTRLLY